MSGRRLITILAILAAGVAPAHAGPVTSVVKGSKWVLKKTIWIVPRAPSIPAEVFAGEKARREREQLSNAELSINSIDPEETARQMVEIVELYRNRPAREISRPNLMEDVRNQAAACFLRRKCTRGIVLADDGQVTLSGECVDLAFNSKSPATGRTGSLIPEAQSSARTPSELKNEPEFGTSSPQMSFVVECRRGPWRFEVPIGHPKVPLFGVLSVEANANGGGTLSVGRLGVSTTID